MAGLGCEEGSAGEVLGALVRVGGEGGHSSKVVEQVVMRLLGRKVKVTEREYDELGEVWRLGRNGFLDLDPAVLAKILETCTKTFVAEIEALIVEALEEEISNLLNPSFVLTQSSILPTLLVRTVATSQELFVKAVHPLINQCNNK